MLTTAIEPLARLACRIAHRAARPTSEHTDPVLVQIRNLEGQWETLRHQQLRYAKAVRRGWVAAARQDLICGRFEREAWRIAVQDCCDAVQAFVDRPVLKLTPHGVLTELQELTDEFEVVGWDKTCLWVTTEPITLEDVELGRFQIRLGLDSIGDPADSERFEVVALEPRPASGNDEVTHPHVSGNRLCAGDARVPLHRALEQGRLADVFQLINAVLGTYNPASPYVRLEDWDGVSCDDCGASVPQDETLYCEACGQQFCDECTTICRECAAVRCRGCLIECGGCGDAYCQACIKSCEACDTVGFCGDCLEDGLCEDCGQESNEEDTDAEREHGEVQRDPDAETEASVSCRTPAEADQADPAVHAGSLAEAAVLLPSGQH